MNDRLKRRLVTIAAAVAISIGWAQAASAQASLAAEDQLDAISVGDRTYVLVRDANNPNQWYYLPNEPKIVVRNIGGVKLPEFHLLTYQYKPDRDSELVREGAILQFSATLDTESDIVSLLRKRVAELRGIKESSVMLAPLPLKKATVSIYSPKGGDLLVDDPFGDGIAPTMAGQKMCFSMRLTRVGADVMTALTKGKTGIPIACTLTYGGLTPPASFSVDVDWDVTYDHYSKNEKFAASASYWGLFGASAAVEKQEIVDELVSSRAIKVTMTTGEAMSADQMEKYLQPILARINSEILESVKPPTKLDPVKVADPQAKGMWGSAGYSVAIKKAKDRKHGKEHIEFSARQYVDRVTEVDSFIGIAPWADDPTALASLITEMPEGDWPAAFCLLPRVDNSWGLSDATLSIYLRNGEKKFDASSVVWSGSEGWIDGASKAPRMLVSFALQPVKALLGSDYAKTRIVTHWIVRQGNITQQFESDTGLFDGKLPIANLNEVVDVISIDPAGLTFAAADTNSKLQSVQVVLKDPRHTLCNVVLRPQPSAGLGHLVPPSAMSIVCDRSGISNATIDILFRMAGSPAPVKWPLSGSVLAIGAALSDYHSILLTDADIPQQQ